MGTPELDKINWYCKFKVGGSNKNLSLVARLLTKRLFFRPKILIDPKTFFRLSKNGKKEALIVLVPLKNCKNQNE
jgi:hypothetical protein